MELRRATLDDVPDVVALVDAVSAVSPASVHWGLEALGEWIARFQRDEATYPWIVAEVDGVFVGFAKAAPYGARSGYAWSTELTIYLAEQARGQGIARPLYGRLFDLVRAQGYRQAWAKITLGNPASERLHAHFGMRRIGVQTRFAWKFDQWWDIGLWQVSLGVDDARPPGPIRSVAEVW